ncbi:MAG TPA: GNAT family N-acetyltransferase [Firmicutes bacterium]|nr:GNAT family N-acetyltransferase [Candidatus Fermentithermobacillaceae bacterium]
MTLSNVVIRKARLEDQDHIRAFTQNTFDWGDYVADALPEWLESGNDVYVAELDGIPVGVTCVAYPAEGEAWFQGIRVKAELRRLGIGTMLTEASIEGARKRGARVCRANIDPDNFRSQGLARSMGFMLAARLAEFRLPLAGSVKDEGSGNGSSSEPNDGPVDDQSDQDIQDIRVRTVTPEEAGRVFDEASPPIRFLGGDYIWISSTRPNFIHAASIHRLLVANDAHGKVLAGGFMTEPYVEDHIHGSSENESDHIQEDGKSYLCAALGALFGTMEGAAALIRHAWDLLVSEAKEKNITPGELFVAVETENPLAEGLLEHSRQAGLGLQRHGETHLWELRLAE